MDNETDKATKPALAVDVARGGRPTKLTEAVQGRIVDAIKAGHFREPAARLAGISPATLYRWLGSAEEPYLSFQAAIEEAEAELEAAALRTISDRLPDDPRLALSFLAKRFPARWGSGAQRVITADEELPSEPSSQQINVLVVGRDELDDAARRHLDAHRQRATDPVVRRLGDGAKQEDQS